MSILPAQTKSLKSQNFNLIDRYTFEKYLGSGTFGSVAAVHDSITQQSFAVKKISDIFNTLVLSLRTLREVKLLRHFNKHDNIVALHDLFVKNYTEESPRCDLYLCVDRMQTDLQKIIHSSQPLTEEHIRYFLYQLLEGVHFIHSANVLHRDLKPSNLLVNENCDLKITDFGMARGVSSTQEEHSNFMTNYIATRSYRAPEIMLSSKEYTKAIDIWSVGCILAEMLNRKVMFPGKDYVHQLNLILCYCGTPSEDYLSKIGSPSVKNYIKKLKRFEPTNCETVFPTASKDARRLVSGLLTFDHNKRSTLETVLKDSFLKDYFQSEDLVVSPPFDFTFDQQELSQKRVRSLLFDEIQRFRPQASKFNSPYGVPSRKKSNSSTKGTTKRRTSDQSTTSQQQQQQSPKQVPVSSMPLVGTTTTPSAAQSQSSYQVSPSATIQHQLNTGLNNPLNNQNQLQLLQNQIQQQQQQQQSNSIISNSNLQQQHQSLSTGHNVSSLHSPLQNIPSQPATPTSSFLFNQFPGRRSSLPTSSSNFLPLLPFASMNTDLKRTSSQAFSDADCSLPIFDNGTNSQSLSSFDLSTPASLSKFGRFEPNPSVFDISTSISTSASLTNLENQPLDSSTDVNSQSLPLLNSMNVLDTPLSSSVLDLSINQLPSIPNLNLNSESNFILGENNIFDAPNAEATQNMYQMSDTTLLNLQQELELGNPTVFNVNLNDL